MSDFITIKTSNLPGELAVAKTYLEDNGIFCFIKDELTNQVYPMAATALGGIKLQVPQEECEEAVRLLIEGGFATIEDYEPDKTMLFMTKIYERLSSLFKSKK